MKAINRNTAVLAGKQVSGKWPAKEIGRAKNTVSRWCSNTVQPSLEELIRVAKVLEVDICDLFRPTLIIK